MSIFHNSALIGASGQSTGGGGGYAIERSLRFNSSDSAYLSRTPASAGNRKTWTWAGWVKRGSLSGTQWLFECSTNATYYTIFALNSDALYFYDQSNGAVTTTAVYRDASAWMHVCLTVDTTQATASNRVKIYVNGSQVTALTGTAYPTLNADTGVNSTTLHSIGARYDGSYSLGFNGYLADIHFIDGQALDPTSFGEFDDNGIWQPIDASGLTYGTNGFHLHFSDNSTAASLGDDTSGNNNDWTVNNISVAAGAGNDSLVDVPTNGPETDTGVGGEVRGNYCTLNPLDRMTDNPVNGNLEWTVASANHRGARSTIKLPTSGKWYYEATVGTASGTMAIGLGIATPSATPGYSNTGTWFIVTNASVTAVIRETSNSTISGMAAPVVGDILQVAYDADNSRVWFGKNNVWVNSTSGTDGNPSTGSNPTVSSLSADQFPCVTAYQATLNINFGQRPFAYTAPSGFKALCTANLPAPLVTKPNTVFDTVLYTGTGSTQTISSLQFNPDFLWIKNRDTAGYNHHLTDAVRGVTQRLRSSTTGAELTTTDQVTAYTSSGFTLGADSAGPGDLECNQNSKTYVAWAWDAGTTTTTNNVGSISSQVRANASAGFSVATWSTNSSSGNATIGHGLNVAPKLIIMKSRNATYNWDIYHGGISNAKDGRLIFTTAAFSTASVPFGGVDPTSTVFTMSQSFYGTGIDCVAYCFAPVAGYSAFGSYTGNGSTTDNTFVYTGMRPRFVMLKRSDSTGNWVIWDAVRNSYNVANSIILPNTSAAEYSPDAKIDILSNGFKVRDNSSDSGTNAATYIWASFAESPFQYARAR